MHDSEKIKKSVFLNVLLKPISLAVGLVYTPLLLSYLGTEKYGVWITILSIINWITTFDIGIGNGLRNCITAELVNNQYEEVSKSVSTAYKVLAEIVFAIYLCAMIIGYFLNWNGILNTSIDVRTTLIITFSFVCVNFVLGLQNNCYYAIQKSEIVAVISVLIQVVNVIGVFIITRINIQGDLNALAIMIGVSGLTVNLAFSLNLWQRRPFFRPRVRLFAKEKLKEICSVGIKFFIIQIAGLVLFTTDSLIITNIFGPSEVTPYNMAYKVFGVGMSVFGALLTPFWSRFTVAKEQRDYRWMRSTINKMLLIWAVFSTAFIVAVPLFRPVVNAWLGQELSFPLSLIVSMSIYFIAYMYSGIYSTALNGLGNINLQLVLAIISAIINIPLSILLATTMGLGTTGVCIGTIVSLLIGDVCFTIQINNIISKGLKESASISNEISI